MDSKLLTCHFYTGIQMDVYSTKVLYGACQSVRRFVRKLRGAQRRPGSRLGGYAGAWRLLSLEPASTWP